MFSWFVVTFQINDLTSNEIAYENCVHFGKNVKNDNCSTFYYITNMRLSAFSN